MQLVGMKENFSDLFTGALDSVSEKSSVVSSYSACGLRGLEMRLHIEHAELIETLEKDIGDDPEHACCSCECLLLRKNVTQFRLYDSKFNTPVWNQLKEYILRRDPNAKEGFMYVCQYCRPLLNSDKLPSRVLNGLETEPVPAELSGLDPLSKQLIQRDKAFQAVVRLGTYTTKVPVYNSLQACKGTMFLPLPLY